MPLYAHWILFSLIFVFVFFSFFWFLGFAWRKYKPTDEQKKNSSIATIKYIFFYWLLDFFYMACFNDWLLWKFIFGCLILVIVFYNLANSFVVPKKRKGFEKLGLLQDFIIGIALTVYLLYIIPDLLLQEIMISVVSAVYGGLITLVGVALTIRFTKKESQEKEKELNKPLIFCDPFYRKPDIKHIYFGDKTKNKYVIMSIINSDKIQFKIVSLLVDSIEYKVDGINFLNKGDKAFLYFPIEEEVEINEIILVTSSLDSYTYKFAISFEQQHHNINATQIEEVIDVKF